MTANAHIVTGVILAGVVSLAAICKGLADHDSYVLVELGLYSLKPIPLSLCLYAFFFSLNAFCCQPDRFLFAESNQAIDIVAGLSETLLNSGLKGSEQILHRFGI